MVFLMYFVYQINLISSEISYYKRNYETLASLYELKGYLEEIQRIFYLKDVKLMRVTVFYNCSFDNISIKNPFGSDKVAVFDSNFNYLFTSSSDTLINFTVKSKDPYENNICIFDGYIGYSENFTIDMNFSGYQPIKVYFSYFEYNFTIDTYQPFILPLKDHDASVYFDDSCTEIEFRVPKILIYLPSYSLDIVKIEKLDEGNNRINVSITNTGRCPIDLTNFMYFTNNNLFTIQPNKTVYGPSFIINPYETKNFTFLNYSDTFCLVSLGFKKCI